MKRIDLKSVLFALIFAVAAAFLSVNVLADEFKPVTSINYLNYDSSEGEDDTTDGGIRNPGQGE